jgi:predicted xylose isomerase-like sugar epimerase
MKLLGHSDLPLIGSTYLAAFGIWATTMSTLFFRENNMLMFALFLGGAALLLIPAIINEGSKKKSNNRIADLEKQVKELKERLDRINPPEPVNTK